MLIFSWLLTRRNVYNKTYGRNSGNVIVKGVTNITTSFIYLLYNLQNSIPLIFKYTNVQQMKIFPTNHYLFKLQSTVFTYLKHLSNAHFSTLIKPFCLVHYNTHKTYNNHPKMQKKKTYALRVKLSENTIKYPYILFSLLFGYPLKIKEGKHKFSFNSFR